MSSKGLKNSRRVFQISQKVFPSCSLKCCHLMVGFICQSQTLVCDKQYDSSLSISIVIFTDKMCALSNFSPPPLLSSRLSLHHLLSRLLQQPPNTAVNVIFLKQKSNPLQWLLWTQGVSTSLSLLTPTTKFRGLQDHQHYDTNCKFGSHHDYLQV